MNEDFGLFLNLASRPSRNRRFYLWARSFLAAVIAAAFLVGGYFTVKFGSEKKLHQQAAAEMEDLMTAARNEIRQLDADILKAERAGRIKVDTINGIIYQKSFSWTDFFSLLEAALPDASYITSLSPNYPGDLTVALKIKVVSRNLDDLLALINNLTARNFKGIRVENEARNERGQLVSEISLTYERVL